MAESQPATMKEIKATIQEALHVFTANMKTGLSMDHFDQLSLAIITCFHLIPHCHPKSKDKYTRLLLQMSSRILPESAPLMEKIKKRVFHDCHVVLKIALEGLNEEWQGMCTSLTQNEYEQLQYNLTKARNILETLDKELSTTNPLNFTVYTLEGTKKRTEALFSKILSLHFNDQDRALISDFLACILEEVFDKEIQDLTLCYRHEVIHYGLSDLSAEFEKFYQLKDPIKKRTLQ